MSEYNTGITGLGFSVKPIDVLEEEARELLIQAFGSGVDLDSQSSLWKVTRVPLTEISLKWVIAEQIFYNCFIQTAEGISLDLLAEDLGLERKTAISAEVELTIYKSSSSAVTVPAGSLFQTTEGIQFATDEEITISAGDPSTTTGTVNVTAVDAGTEGNVAASSITQPTNTISGVDSSDNASAATGGEDEETDTALRKRLRAFVRATWTRSAIRSAALNIEGVTGVKIIESTTSYTCLIVPQTSFDSALQAEIEAAIEAVTPVTVEYSVEEAESVEIDVVADVVLDSLYTEASAEQDTSVEIAEYIATLEIDDDVILAKVVQAIMEVDSILNAYNIVLTGKPVDEKHTYSTGTLTYLLNYFTGVDSAAVIVKGTVGGSPHTFIKGTDYNFNASPADVTFTGTGSLPDNGTDILVTYTFPDNAIGDIEINTQSIAKIGTVDLTEV